jgi:hypothetical protein
LQIADLPEELGLLGLEGFISSAKNDLLVFRHDFRIRREGDLFSVADMERGMVVDLLMKTADENAACIFFLEEMSGRYHFLATSRDPNEIAKIEAALSSAAIPHLRNDIPEIFGKEITCFRLLVQGKNMAYARSIIQ